MADVGKSCSKLKCCILSILVACVAYFIYKHYALDKNIPIEGYFDPKFRPIAEMFREQVWSRASRGCSLAVYHRGVKVVDLWGGYADSEFHIPWRNYTLTKVASVTKGMAAFGLALLVQRGLLSYDEPMSHYWPEFGQDGKDNITVAMFLSHQSGLLGLSPPMPTSWIKDWTNKVDEMDKLLASQKPAWPPGELFGYGPLTYGLYFDALVRHVDPKKRTAAQFFHDEIAVPYGIDFHIGLPRELFHRKTRGDSPFPKLSWYINALKTLRYTKLALGTFTNKYFHMAEKVLDIGLTEMSDNDPELASVPYVSGMGFGSANSVAKLFSYLATPGDNDLLTSQMIDRLSTPLVSGYDSVLGVDASYTLGLWAMDNVLGEKVIGHTGYGGQLAFADRRHEMSMSYLTNDLTLYVIGGDPKVMELERTVYECIEKMEQ